MRSHAIYCNILKTFLPPGDNNLLMDIQLFSDKTFSLHNPHLGQHLT